MNDPKFTNYFAIHKQLLLCLTTIKKQLPHTEEAVDQLYS